MQLVIVFVLSLIGGFLGVNFGGSMLLVTPALLGLGWAPLIVLASSRPAIIAQSLTGITAFRKFSNLDRRGHAVLAAGASAGALAGVALISRLNHRDAAFVVMSILIVLCFIAIIQTRLYKLLARDTAYATEPHGFVGLFITGFLPATIGGTVGTGAGLLVVICCLVLLRMRLQNASYAEKIVSLSHAVTTLCVTWGKNSFDIKLAVVVLTGVTLGAIIGTRVTLHFSSKWMYLTIIAISILILWRMLGSG